MTFYFFKKLLKILVKKKQPALHVYVYKHVSFINTSNKMQKKKKDIVTIGNGYIVLKHVSSRHEFD